MEGDMTNEYPKREKEDDLSIMTVEDQIIPFYFLFLLTLEKRV
jgi:hypothetical protein